MAVVDHRGGRCRVRGGFGTGKTTALRARAERLRDEGLRPLLLSHRELVAFAVDVLRRHGHDVSLVSDADQMALLAPMLDGTTDAPASDVARTLTAYQASFLGDEELRVHADAAGSLASAEVLIELTQRYLAAMRERGAVDRGGALVQASLALRDEAVLQAERDRFDELLIDDFQLATFGTNRLVSQLVGPADVPVTVAGNEDAAVSDEPLTSPVHLARFARRFGATLDVVLDTSQRAPGVPALRIVEDGREASGVPAEVVQQAGAVGVPAEGVRTIERHTAVETVGDEWPVVVVLGATSGRWPAPRPSTPWFDDELFHGPDVAGAAERDRRWEQLERRRFRVATSRATRFLIVVGEAPVSPLVAELVAPPGSGSSPGAG